MRGIRQLSKEEIPSLKIAIQRLVQRGCTVSEISDALDLKPHTVLRIEPSADMFNT